VTAPGPVHYRKLPGRLRGVIRGASIWMGPDHLLAVRSTRFREEYKRFYLRDVQAIVVADAPRFHISARAMLLAVVWFIVYLSLERRFPWADTVFWTGAALMVAVWLYISAAGSCRCRIHTAVSREDLPSIYRRRTARRFLAKVEPLIGQAQGVLEGDWTKAAAPLYAMPATVSARAPATHTGAVRTWATDLLIASLFSSAAVNLLFLLHASREIRWMAYLCNLVEVAAAAAVLVQHYRGQLRPAMQRLAIAALIVMGLVLYLQPLSVGLLAGMEAAKTGRPAHVDVDEIGGTLGMPLFRQFDIGASTVLGCVGLWILLRSEDGPA
jgi:hypothetical protein